MYCRDQQLRYTFMALTSPPGSLQMDRSTLWLSSCLIQTTAAQHLHLLVLHNHSGRGLCAAESIPQFVFVAASERPCTAEFAEVCLFLLVYVMVQELIFVSKQAVFQPPKAIRYCA